MKFSKQYQKFLEIIFLFLIAVLFINMTGGGSSNIVLEPEFVKLKEGEGAYSGKIFDDRVEVDVDELSFTGNTSIGGIRKETDDSVNVLDFSIMKELRIVNTNYLSKRFSDKEFILAKVTFSSVPENPEEFLIPRNIVICARDSRTGQKKAWFLNKLQKIIINREPKKIIIKEEVKEKSWMETIVEKVSP